ncbi:hypothetical protein [Halobellus ordinarius]|uniref:hypothetical protein n=1 Tax=Halobellus ordinarius TaxID=3075120 RepID=UPI0028804280|nr:hypothetical protein [Halobellus sp. ZY16]
MDRTVDGEEWVERGWVRVVEFLYNNDVTTELNIVSVPGEISGNGYEGYERLGSQSRFLEETGLTEDQAMLELEYLRKQNLVDLFQPFEESEFGVNRLTSDGFSVAHDIQRTKREEQWRNQNSFINLVLTVATGVLAASAIVQGILAYYDSTGVTQQLIFVTYAAISIVLALLMLGRRGYAGPDLWG